MAKILTFQTNTDKKLPVVPPPDRIDGKIFTFASQSRVVVVHSPRGAVALRFPEAWWPFVVVPSAQFTHS